jgi:hypothetical protein
VGFVDYFELQLAWGSCNDRTVPKEISRNWIEDRKIPAVCTRKEGKVSSDPHRCQ